MAKTIFEYVDKDRDRLRLFLGWVDHTKSIEDVENFIKRTHEKWNERSEFHYGLFKTDGTYIGNLSVHSVRWDHDVCEFGYWIRGDYEGQGLMSKAVRLIESYVFSEGFNRVQIRCSDLNKRSARVSERNNYMYEGTARMDFFGQGKYRNTQTFSKLCSEYIEEREAPFIRRARNLDAKNIIQVHKESIQEVRICRYTFEG